MLSNSEIENGLIYLVQTACFRMLYVELCCVFKSRGYHTTRTIMWAIASNITEPYLVIRQSLEPLQLSRWQLTKLFVKTIVAEIPRGVRISLVAATLMLVVYFVTSKERVAIPRDLPVVKGNSSHFEDIIREGRKKAR